MFYDKMSINILPLTACYIPSSHYPNSVSYHTTDETCFCAEDGTAILVLNYAPRYYDVWVGGGIAPHILNVRTFICPNGRRRSSTALLPVPCPCRESNTDRPVICTGEPVPARNQLYLALTKPIFLPP